MGAAALWKLARTPLISFLGYYVIFLLGTAGEGLGRSLERLDLALSLLLGFMTVGSVLLSVCLYSIRRINRVWYGILELVVTLMLFFTTFVTILKRGDPALVLPPYIAWADGFQASLTFLAALYVGVRGLDNIGEGLAPETRLHRVWSVIFPKA